MAAFLVVELWVAFLVIQASRLVVHGSDQTTLVLVPVFLGLGAAFLVKTVRIALEAQAAWARWVVIGALVLVVLPGLLLLAVAAMGGIGKGMGGGLAAMMLVFVVLAFIVAPLLLEGVCWLVGALNLLAWRPLLVGLVGAVVVLVVVVEPIAWVLLQPSHYPLPLFGSWEPALGG